MSLQPGESLRLAPDPDGRLQVIAVKAELLEARNPELLIVIILEGGHCRAEHLCGEGRHRLGRWVYAIDYSLKLFVSKGGATIVLLNDPKRRGNKV